MSNISYLVGKVLRGDSIAKREAYHLGECKKSFLPALLEAAMELRRISFADVLTYSRNVFLPITRFCRNSCSYCSFRFAKSDGIQPNEILMTQEDVLAILQEGEKRNCKEALFISGEEPESHREFRERLHKLGYRKFTDYIKDLCSIVIQKTGLLPHINIGLIPESDLEPISEVSASMGLMLESTSYDLFKSGGPHEFSPGKNPHARLEMIKKAGKKRIPFTTGIIVGIGETARDRVDSLFEIANLHRSYGHIQEVIVQNYVPGPKSTLRESEHIDQLEILHTICLARLLLPKEVSIQVAPNLNPVNYCLLLLGGVNDLGGISEVTIDEINPYYKWPQINDLKGIAGKYGFVLKERLPLYPPFINKKWIKSIVLLKKLSQLIDSDGFLKQ